MIIYKTTNLINGMSYVGQDVNNNPNYLGGGLYFNNVLRKHGKINFKKEIICECKTKEELNEKEIYYIKYYNTKKPNGYNLTDGGEGNLGWVPSEETKKNIGNGLKEFWKNIPEDLYKKISEDRSKRMKGVGNPMYGKKRPEHTGINNPSNRPEVKEKLSKIFKGYVFKKLLKYNYSVQSPTGEIFVIDSVRRFCKEKNIDRNILLRSLKNKTKIQGWYIEIIGRNE